MLFVCVCVCVCLVDEQLAGYVCAHARLHVCIFIHMRVSYARTHTHTHTHTHRCGYAYQPNKNILYPAEDLEDDDDNEEGKEAGEAAPMSSDSMSVDASEVRTSVQRLFE